MNYTDYMDYVKIMNYNNRGFLAKHILINQKLKALLKREINNEELLNKAMSENGGMHKIMLQSYNTRKLKIKKETIKIETQRNNLWRTLDGEEDTEFDEVGTTPIIQLLRQNYAAVKITDVEFITYED